MPDRAQSTRVICQGGLDSTQNYLNLSANKPGCATRLVNYEVGLSGGYRRVEGYSLYDETYGEVGVGAAEGRILGLIMFKNTATGVDMVIAARQDLSASTYSFYQYDSGTGWSAISTGLTHYYTSGGADVDKLRWDVGNDGATNVLCVVDGVNNALLYDGTNWTYIDTSDTGADFAHAGGPQALDAPTVVDFFESTLFLSNDIVNSAKGVVAYSAPNAYYDWTSGNGAGQIPVGFDVVQIKPFRESNFVFGENSIKKIIPDATAGFLLRNITTNIGCMSADSVVEIGGDLIFLAPDGFRPIAGTDKIGDIQLASLSKPIQKLIKARLEGNSGLDTASVVIRGKSQFRLFFGSSNVAAADSKGIIGCLRTEDQTNGWEFGELTGFRATCAVSKYINGLEYVLHGDYDGMVYRQENGNSLNGSALTSIYSTPYLDLGDTEIRKTAEKITTFLVGEGNLGISMALSYDWGRETVSNPAAYETSISSNIIEYDDGTTFDDPVAVYGGILTPVSVKNVEGSFFSIRITYTTSGTEFPHSVHGIVIEFKPEGRR